MMSVSVWKGLRLFIATTFAELSLSWPIWSLAIVTSTGVLYYFNGAAWLPVTAVASLLDAENVFTKLNTFNLGLIVNETGDPAGDLRAESNTEANMLLLDADVDILHLGGSTGTQVAKGGYLVLPAGTATAGQAPLRLTAGTLLGTPEAGAMEFDGTGLYLTPTNHRRFISLASDAIIATTTATTVASTTLWTGVTNANELKPYRVYRVEMAGLVNNLSAASIATITVNFGATTVVTLATPGAKLTNDPWNGYIYVTVRTTGDIATGTVSAHGYLYAGTSFAHAVTESIACDTTVANDLTIKVTWSGADAANWLKLTQCWLGTAD